MTEVTLQMVHKPTLTSVVLALVIVAAAATFATGSVAAAAEPSITISDAPDTAGVNSSFQTTYAIENTGADGGAFSFTLTNPSGVTSTGISGDINENVDSKTGGSTTFTESGETASVTVDYRVAGDASLGDTTLEIQAEQSFDGTSDSNETTVTLQDAVADPNVSIADGSNTVRHNSTYEDTFDITNIGTEPGSFSVSVTNTASGIDIVGLEGDTETTTLDPPSASTIAVAPNESAAITVEYAVDNNATLGATEIFSLVAEQGLDGTSDSKPLNVTVAEPVENGRERVAEVTGKQSSELTTTDVSNVITLYNRGEARNGISVNTGDISNTVTLFNRYGSQ